MSLKGKAWKYATAIVVVLIIINPEMIELALLIDAVGLEMFLMLLEVQALTIIAVLLNGKIEPVISSLKRFVEKHFLFDYMKMIKEGAEGLVLPSTIEAAFMHLLVFSSLLGGVVEACL